MAHINYTALFVALGRLGCSLNNLNTFRGTTLPLRTTEIPTKTTFQQYPTVAAEAIDALNSLATSNNLKSTATGLRSAARDLLLDVVNAATGDLSNTDLQTALKIFVQTYLEEVTSGAIIEIEKNTISASEATYATNVGNGVVTVALDNGDGALLQHCYAETAKILCTDDAVSGRSTAASEQFTVTGATQQKDKLAASWPAGSGASVKLNSLDAATYASTANVLSNGAWETWTTNTPSKWALIAGTAGVEIFKESTNIYAGTYAAKFVGNTGTNLVLEQVFNDSTNGTAGVLKPNTHYSYCYAIKASGSLASGSIALQLYDKTNARVITNASGSSESSTLNLNQVGTSYGLVSGYFLTPKSLPASYSIRIVMASQPAGNVFFDHFSLGEMTELYTNGPHVGIHTGSHNWVQLDQVDLIVANNYGSAWCSMLERLFDLNDYALIFPCQSASTAATLLDSYLD